MGNIKEDKGRNPLVNNHFLLRVDAIYDLPCAKISGFSQEKEFETIQAGGVNDYVYLREKPATKPVTFEVERYVGEKFYNPLTVGKHFTIPIVLYVSRYINAFNDAKQVFYFTGCTVMSKKYGELNAEKSGLLVETTTIAYQKVYMMQSVSDNPVASWNFDQNGKREGSGKRKAIYDRTEERKRELEQKKRIWPEERSARTLSKFQK